MERGSLVSLTDPFSFTLNIRHVSSLCVCSNYSIVTEEVAQKYYVAAFIIQEGPSVESVDAKKE